jgi:hypothetical protein
VVGKNCKPTGRKNENEKNLDKGFTAIYSLTRSTKMFWEIVLLGGSMNWKVLFYLGVGVFLGLALNNTIAGFVNPVITPAKLSVALAG